MSRSVFNLEKARIRSAVNLMMQNDPHILEDASAGASILEDENLIATLFARSVWSRLSEPGDSVAGIMLECLGPSASLEALVEGASSENILAKIHDCDSCSEELLTQKSLGSAFQRWKPRLISAEALQSAEAISHVGAWMSAPELPQWPRKLDDLGYHSPPAIWLRGNTPFPEPEEKTMSLVGARASTGYGEHITAELSAGVSSRGVTVVSGGAYGIDGMAHRAALACGGQTIAILAGGIDRLYPSGHDALFTKILSSGTIITEMPPGFSPTKWRFLQRNRLISALGDATIVCEAGRRSGSLNTAGHAAALGRVLGAVPGPVTSATSAGCHTLLRDYQAVCVTNVEQALELVTPLMGTIAGQTPEERGVRGEEQRHGMFVPRDELPPTHLRIRDAMSGRRARSVEEIAKLSGQTYAEVRSGLAELMVEGLAVERPDGWSKTTKARE